MSSRNLTATALLCLGAMTPALAHHSFSMFDSVNHITLEGQVREVQWSNPHIWVQFVVPTKDGKTLEYSVEGQSPNVLLRMGWSKSTLKSGDTVKLVIAPLKDGKPGGSLESVEWPDGRKLSAVRQRDIF